MPWCSFNLFVSHVARTRILLVALSCMPQCIHGANSTQPRKNDRIIIRQEELGEKMVGLNAFVFFCIKIKKKRKRIENSVKFGINSIIVRKNF